MMNSLRRTAPAFASTTTRVAVLLAGTVLFAACGKEKEAVANTAPAVQTIGPDNIAVVTTDTLRSGPAISGTLVADREARIRAEGSGAVDSRLTSSARLTVIRSGIGSGVGASRMVSTSNATSMTWAVAAIRRPIRSSSESWAIEAMAMGLWSLN